MPRPRAEAVGVVGIVVFAVQLGLSNYLGVPDAAVTWLWSLAVLVWSMLFLVSWERKAQELRLRWRIPSLRGVEVTRPVCPSVIHQSSSLARCGG